MTAGHSVVWRTWLVAGLAALLETSPAAQYPGRVADQYPPEWESDSFRVRRLALAPGAHASEPAADSVLVFLTADLHGRMPAAEAVWVPSGSTLENGGSVRFEAVLIELKEGPANIASTTPPEARPTTDRVDVWRLIDNPRVLVTKLRYKPVTSIDPMHFHLRDTLVVYLKGGYVWQAVERSRDWQVWPFMRWAPTLRVFRSDVDVVPANTFHSFGNAGGDPLEFVAIFVK